MRTVLLVIAVLSVSGCAVVGATAAVGSAAVSVGATAVSIRASAVGVAADAAVGTAKIVGSAVTPSSSK